MNARPQIASRGGRISFGWDGKKLHLNQRPAFRNIIVHQYEEVDAEVVVLILKEHLIDFQRFKEAILIYLKKFS